MAFVLHPVEDVASGKRGPSFSRLLQPYSACNRNVSAGQWPCRHSFNHVVNVHRPLSSHVSLIAELSSECGSWARRYFKIRTRRGRDLATHTWCGIKPQVRR